MDHLLRINKENLCKQEIQIMPYGKYKDLKKRAKSDKVLKDKAFEIVKNLKYGGYQRGLASMVYKFFDKNLKGSGIKNEIKEN